MWPHLNILLIPQFLASQYLGKVELNMFLWNCVHKDLGEAYTKFLCLMARHMKITKLRQYFLEKNTR